MVSCIETYDYQWGHQPSQRTTHHFWILVFIYELVIWEGVDAWKYNYSDTNLTWEDAREYCQKSFTDLVAIQNQEEINHLNQILPRNPTYYWIGIRKIAGVWTWVGTNKSLDKKAENWAEGEPTSGGEDCVEIYIKRQKEAGKWNNHSCNKMKAAICYLASCKPNSCNNRGECVETVGDYKCLCDEGFYGSRCESVKQCASLSAPVQAKMLCSHPLGNFSFNSTCDFHCMAGFTLQGSQSLQCTAAGQWTAETPSCEAVECGNLEIPEKGYMNCSHPFRDFSYKSVCTFSCDKGFHLGGLDSIQCGTSGQWNGQKPTCEVKQCASLSAPVQAKMLCSHPLGNFSFNSTCDFHCMAGFTLQGSQSLQCTAAGQWTAETPSCEAVECGNLEIPEKGYMNCSHPFRDFSYKSVCTFSCDKGFHLGGLDSIQCGTSGQWNGQKPTCEVKQCASLSAPVQAKMLCSHPLGNFSFNSTCDFHCMAGFTLQGSQSLQCTAAGQWTAETPSCEAVECGNLEIPEKGYMNCSHPFRDFSYKSVCTFSCDKGFHLGGLDSIQCGTSGQWNGQKPTCEAMQYTTLEFCGQGISNCTDSTGEFNDSLTDSLCRSARSELCGPGTQETRPVGNWTTQSPTTKVYIFDKMWEPQKATVAAVGTAFALLLLSFVVWGIIRRYRKAKQEKNPLARNEDNLETTAV